MSGQALLYASTQYSETLMSARFFQTKFITSVDEFLERFETGSLYS
jgi:hypothetical protein